MECRCYIQQSSIANAMQPTTCGGVEPRTVTGSLLPQGCKSLSEGRRSPAAFLLRVVTWGQINSVLEHRSGVASSWVISGSILMKLPIFGIVVVTLGAISRAEAADIEFSEAKTQFKSSTAVDGKALLRVWEHDWRHTNLPRGCFINRRVTTCAVTSLQSNYICR